MVFTDVLCWAPIIILKGFVLGGSELSSKRVKIIVYRLVLNISKYSSNFIHRRDSIMRSNLPATIKLRGEPDPVYFLHKRKTSHDQNVHYRFPG